jgi:hypothetical protein
MRPVAVALLALVLCGSAHAARSPQIATATAGLQKAVAAGRVAPADAARYRAILDRTARALPRLGGSRHDNLAGVLSDVAASAPRYAGARALTLFSMLDWNTRWFGAQGPPAPQADTVASDQVVYRYFPGHGLQFHPLGNFAALNSLLAGGRLDEARILAESLRARAVSSGPAAVWEYEWAYAGGRPPWTSGMAQAVAAQALARAGQRLADPSLGALARRAYAAVPKLVMQLPVGPWVKLYSFSRDAVFNAQLQTTVSLRDYADIAGDTAAGSLSDALRAAVQKGLPQADTGYWTRYTLGGAEEPRGYHDFVTTILGRLYAQTKDTFWSDLASKFKAYTTQPPSFQLGPPPTPVPGAQTGKATASFSFWLSKQSDVVLSAAGGQRRLTMSFGWHHLTWTLPRAKAGIFPVGVRAAPIAGPTASLSLPPLVVLARAPASLGELALAAGRGGGPAGTSGLVIGAVENAVANADPAISAQQFSLATAAGLRAIRVAVAWSPGQAAVDPALVTAAQQAALAGVRLYLELYPAAPALVPGDDAHRAEFAAYARQLAAALPQVRDFVIGQQVNDPAFWPQSATSAGSYLALLAASYDALKGLDPGIQVIGGALDSQFAPGTYVLSLGQAYRRSGRVSPVMDALALQPSGASSAEPPDAAHPSGPTTIGDYTRLVANLKRALDTTPQPGAALPIVYDGYAVQTAVPAQKAALYTGAENDTVPESAQGALYAQALQVVSCQPNVAALLFGHVVDERDLAGSQSGLYYPDLTPKSDFSAVRAAVAAAQTGSLAPCPGAPPRAAVPPSAEAAADGRSIQVRCARDCAYVAALVRAAVPLRAQSGLLTGGATVTVSIPGGAAPGDRVMVHVASKLDPRDEVVVQGAPIA